MNTTNLDNIMYVSSSRYVIGAYCTHKRSVLVREFLEALTKGAPDQNGTLQPPLEMSADDPHTYVARMMSFLLTALENHNLSVLFSQCDKIGKKHIKFICC